MALHYIMKKNQGQAQPVTSSVYLVNITNINGLTRVVIR